MTPHANVPEPVHLPSRRHLLQAFVPFIGLLAVLFYFLEAVNDNPSLAIGVGAVVLLLWLAWLGWLGGAFAHSLDFWLRTSDFLLNRTYGPPLDKNAPRAWIVKILLTRGGIVNGYSAPIVLWSFLALHIVVFGPTRTLLTDASDLMKGVVVFGSFLLIVLLAAVFAWLAWRTHWLHGFSTLLILTTIAAIAGWLWFTTAAGEVVAEADHLVYPHIFLFFLAFIALLAYLARFLACCLVSGFKKRFDAQWTDSALLRHAELFERLKQPRIPFVNVFLSAIATPLRNPHLLLYPIAVAVLLTPHAYMTFATVATALFAWSVLAVAGIHERLHFILNWMNRNFFHGVLLAVSLLVIVLAACRLFDFSYVATIMNSTSAETLIWFLITIYATLWFYKYWIGQTLCEHLLDILRTKKQIAEGKRGQMDYPIDQEFVGTKVVRAERVLQVHGTRFAAIGNYQLANGASGVAWQFYDAVELFEAIAKKQPDDPKITSGAATAPAQEIPANQPGDPTLLLEPGGPQVICKPRDPQDVDAAYGLSDLRQRVQVYYVILDTLVVIALIVFFVLRLKPDPIAELQADHQEGPFALQQHLFKSKDAKAGAQDKRKAAVLFAASGGGTRAAVYAASVFQGLDELGALSDVKLCSGVSGGSTAIAHLAIFRDDLIDAAGPDKPHDKAQQEHAANWQQYAEAMSAPFIDDVLCGTLEVRIAFGTRMGTLLDESFHRHMEPKKTLKNGTTLADAKFGIIFNSTLAGTEPYKKPPESINAGSRLIVTNLRLDDNPFPTAGYTGADTEFLHYVVVKDRQTRLATGAALSANFPPVFSNAAVDVKNKDGAVDRHWVTDGGASENRGIISLLFVLLKTLQQEAAGARREPLPIQIVIAEASGVSLDFSQDRGIGSTLGASEKYTSQLMVELLAQIDEVYKKLGGKDLKVHFLPMPLVFRSRGGVGTNWKLPAFVTLANPDNEKDTMTLNGKLARQLIMDLHHPDAKPRPAGANEHEKAQAEKAWTWIEAVHAEKRFGRQHREAWTRLVTTFKELGYTPKNP